MIVLYIYFVNTWQTCYKTHTNFFKASGVSLALLTNHVRNEQGEPKSVPI